MPQISVSLPNNLQVKVRSVVPSDRAHFVKGMDALSEASRFYRFHGHGFRLNDRILDYLTDLDDVNHVALGALCKKGREEEAIGVGRFIRSQSNEKEAELALTICDAYQRRGIGSLLLTCLSAMARDRGIERFTFAMHAERGALISKLQTLGTHVRGMDSGVFEMEMEVPQNAKYNALGKKEMARYTELIAHQA